MAASLRLRLLGKQHDTAQLSVRGCDALDVRVLGTEDGTHAIHLPRHAPEIRKLHREKGMLELGDGTTQEGLLMAIEGKNRRMLPDRMQFLIDGLPNGAQKRQWTRVPVVIPVRVGVNPQRRDWREGWTVDLSAGGALIGGVQAGKPGGTLRIQFALPQHEERLVCVGAVTRITDAGLRALRWTAIDAGDRQIITDYLDSELRRVLDRRYAS
ncbi:MAG: PilZ domain-containing protein [Solirubrobacteraceae bacterium]|nr:PilZ domain-containing protein [Solirubrobacteraceae bacterium]